MPSTQDNTKSMLPSRKGARLTEDQIHAAAKHKLAVNRDYYNDTLNSNREAAYAYYRGEMPAASEAHDSTIVSTDVSDVIEWVLPAIIKSFVESPDVVRFDPVNPEDQCQADLESDYVHHVFMKKCGGFLKLYNHIKDALLLKTGVFCTYWDEGVTHQKEEYSGYSEIEIADLLSPSDGSEVQVLSTKSYPVPVIDPLTGSPVDGEPEILHDLVVRRFRRRGRPVVENCTPDGFVVDLSHDSIDLSEVSWCAYSTVKPRAYLLSLGYNEDKVDALKGADSALAAYVNEVRYYREDVERENIEENETADKTQDLVDLHRVYHRLDADGDGYEEQYIIILGGPNGEEMLDYYEVPENPFSASTPFIAAHKFYGYSLFDKLKQVANHKTKLLRMMEDNLDLQNNPRKKVLRGRANLDDVLSVRVGGVWRMDQPDAVTEVPTIPIDQTAGALLSYYDKIRTERSGVDPNAESIAKIMPEESMNSAVERVLSAKEEIVGLLIRVFAETGVKDMFLKLRGLMMRYNPREEIVQLRNKWTTINPGNWVERSDTTIVVGLGTGDRIKKSTGLQMVFGMQQQAMAGGLQGILVSPERMAFTIGEMIRVQGLGDPEDYVLDPALIAKDPRNIDTPRGQEMARAQQLLQQQAQQAAQQQAAQQQAQQAQAQMMAQIQMQIAQMQEETKRMTAQMKAQSEQSSLQAEVGKFMEEMRFKYDELEAKFQTDQAKEASKAGQAMMQAAVTRQAAVEQSQSRREVAEMQQVTSLAVAEKQKEAAEANEPRMTEGESDD